MWFLLTVEWEKLFVPKMSLPEIAIRGVIVYLSLVVMMRVVLKRQAGKVALGDLLVVSIVAGVCRNPLITDAYSITDGMLVVAVVLASGYAVDWASYHSAFIHGIVHAPPCALIKDGEIQEKNLRHELLTRSQLDCKLRLHGLKDAGDVEQALMEGDGEISVIKAKVQQLRRDDKKAGLSGNGILATMGQSVQDDLLDHVSLALQKQSALNSEIKTLIEEIRASSNSAHRNGSSTDEETFPMTTKNLEKLPASSEKSDAVNVVIETSKGCRNKFAYDAKLGTFQLRKVLPAGMSFPYDFGFVPSSLAEDGDPLDVLVLMDEPAFAGCLIECRLVGVIEGVEAEDGEKVRNDRLLAVAKCSHAHSHIESIKDVNPTLLDELEHFFSCYNDLDEKTFTPIGRHGPRKAKELLDECRTRFEKKS